MRQLKQLAAETHRTFTAVIEDAVREVLARRKKKVLRASVKLPTFRGDGLQPGVNLESKRRAPGQNGRPVILPDVNILVNASREDAVDHRSYKRWLEDVVRGDQAYGLCDLVLSGFLRIVTHPRIFNIPTPLETAISFAETIRSPSHCVLIAPGPAHWDIFTTLCRKTAARGNHVADAYLAALTIESGSELLTADRDFSRYPGLRWRPSARLNDEQMNLTKMPRYAMWLIFILLSISGSSSLANPNTPSNWEINPPVGPTQTPPMNLALSTF